MVTSRNARFSRSAAFRICGGALLLAIALALSGCAGSGGKTEQPGANRPHATAPGEYRDTFAVRKANLAATGTNPCFELEPGARRVYRHGDTVLTITVLDETKLVDGVQTRVVEEREERNGQPLEISRNYFAIDKTTNDVYYFGEDVDIYKNGQIANHGGAWLSGVNGARFGLLVPGRVKVGDKFYQEVAPQIAMDRAEITAVDEPVTTPAGAFPKCLHVKETSPLESGSSDKWYAPGVGLVQDDEFVLVRTEKGKAQRGGDVKQAAEEDENDDDDD